jgi:Ca2+-binding EF-hand superfamily protein
MNSPRFLSRSCLVAATLVFAASNVALAAPGDPRATHGRHAMQAALFDRIDADRDGSISRAEFDAMTARRFARIDADGDGTISLDEMLAWHGLRHEDRVRARFARLDADGDGRISVDEMAAAADRRFARMDRDGDGTISREEFGRRWSGKRGHGRR